MIAPSGSDLGAQAVSEVVAQACPAASYRGKKVLLIVPDATRTAPVDLFFKSLHEQIAAVTAAFDVMVALGTHPPMSEEAICQRLGISLAERGDRYRSVRLLNHEWDNPDALKSLGTIPAGEISELSGGLFAMDVEVKINRRLFDYDQIIIVGPVFPHEVVGFSGGNKYLFPGVSGPEVLNFFHWLGAVVTNPMIIGNKWTPVRKVVDRAGLDGQAWTSSASAWSSSRPSLRGCSPGRRRRRGTQASELSRKLHITYKEKPFHTILSCAPKMYDELWTGGKCMYKLEPVVADGGELIIYAPHITEVSVTHGQLIEQIGYHCRDYFLKQWDKFKHMPWGVLAHSTHVRGDRHV